MSNKKLDLAPFVPEKPESYDIQTSDDFDFARKNMYEIINKTLLAVEDMTDVARASQHPRAYEVLNAILKNAMDQNKDLIELQKKRHEITKLLGKDPDTSEHNKTVNNLFVGSNEELNDLINKIRSDNNDSPADTN